jgi:hypothetical protein
MITWSESWAALISCRRRWEAGGSTALAAAGVLRSCSSRSWHAGVRGASLTADNGGPLVRGQVPRPAPLVICGLAPDETLARDGRLQRLGGAGGGSARSVHRLLLSGLPGWAERASGAGEPGWGPASDELLGARPACESGIGGDWAPAWRRLGPPTDYPCPPSSVRCQCQAAAWAMEWQRRCTASAWPLARGVAGGLGLAGEVAGVLRARDAA